MLASHELRQLILVDVAELHQAVAEAVAALRLFLERFGELLLRDEPITNERFAKPVWIYRGGGHVMRVARRVIFLRRGSFSIGMRPRALRHAVRTSRMTCYFRRS